MGKYQKTDLTKKTNEVDENKPPLVVDTIHDVFFDWTEIKNNSLPEFIPPNLYDAARWWIECQEKPDGRRERPRLQREHGRTHWITPYHDRLVFALKKYLPLTAPQQAFILEHIRAGIPWRGDEINYYNQVVEHQRMMDKNPELFKKYASKIIKQFAKSKITAQ